MEGEFDIVSELYCLTVQNPIRLCKGRGSKRELPNASKRRLTGTKSKLAKFVQINWCGEGVPESKKGLFRE